MDKQPESRGIPAEGFQQWTKYSWAWYWVWLNNNEAWNKPHEILDKLKTRPEYHARTMPAWLKEKDLHWRRGKKHYATV